VAPPTTEADDTAEDDEIPGDAAEEEPVEESAASPEGEAPTPASARARSTSARWPLVAVGLAVLFGLVSAVMIPAYIRLRSDRDADSTSGQDRTAVATVAAQLAEAMTAIDATGENKDQADVVHRLGTGPLIEQYDATIPATRKLLVAVNVTSERGQITPGGVYVGDVDADQAQVIVVIDLVVVGQVTKVVPNQYLRMHLVKLNGEWKVDNVSDVNAGLAGSSGSDSAPTSIPTPLSTESSSS
jgi:hypothetical protein